MRAREPPLEFPDTSVDTLSPRARARAGGISHNYNAKYKVYKAEFTTSPAKDASPMAVYSAGYRELFLAASTARIFRSAGSDVRKVACKGQIRFSDISTAMHKSRNSTPVAHRR